MTPAEASAAVVDNHILVVSASGVIYRVYGDTIETYGDYVYGERVSPCNSGGPFDHTPHAGAIKWFFLSNVTLVTSQ